MAARHHLFVHSLLLLAALLGATGAAAAPSAQAQARADFREGLRLRKAGKLDRACDAFERSYGEDAEPGALYNLAHCREQQGRFAEAHQELVTLAQRAIEAKQTETASTMLADAERLVPRLARLDLARRDDARSLVTSVTVDGQVVLEETWTKPLYVMPGVHRVAAIHGDGQTVERTSRDLPAGASERLELDDPPPPPPAPRPESTPSLAQVDRARRIGAYAGFGVGGGLVVAGAITGALSFRKKSDATGICGGSLSSCNGDSGQANADLSTARHLATVSTVGFAAAGVAVATGLVLFVSSNVTVAPLGATKGGGLALAGCF